VQTVDVVLRIVAPPGTNRSALEDDTEDLVELLCALPGVRQVPEPPGLSGEPLDKGSPGALEVGVAVLSVVAAAPQLYELAARIRDWVRADGRYRVRIETDDEVFEAEATSEEDIQAVVKAWLRRQREG
jgi:hypothetical protein